MPPNNSNLNDSWVRIPSLSNIRDVPIVQILEINSETDLGQTSDNSSESDSVVNIINRIRLGNSAPLEEEEKQQTIIEDKKDNYFVHFIIHTLASVWGIQIGQHICKIMMKSHPVSPSAKNSIPQSTHKGKIIIFTSILQLLAIKFGYQSPEKNEISDNKKDFNVGRRLITAYLGYFLQSKKFNNLYIEIFSKGICSIAYCLNTIEIMCPVFGTFTEHEQLKLLGIFKTIMITAAFFPILLCYFDLPNSNFIFSPFDTNSIDGATLPFSRYPMTVFIIFILLGVIDFKPIYQKISGYLTTNLVRELSCRSLSSSIKMFFYSMRWSNIGQMFQDLIPPPSLTTKEARKVSRRRILPRAFVISYMVSILGKSMITMDYSHIWFYNIDFIFRITAITAINVFPLIGPKMKQYAFESKDFMSHWYRSFSPLYANFIYDSYREIPSNFLMFPYSSDIIALFELFGDLTIFNNRISGKEPFYDIFARINWAFLTLFIWGSVFDSIPAKTALKCLNLMPLSTLTFYSIHCLSGDIETWE